MIISEFLRCGTLVCIGDGKLLIGWGQRQWTQTPSPDATPSFYFPDFFLQGRNPWFQHPHWQKIGIAELANQLTSIPTHSPLPWETSGKQFFLDTVADLKERFKTQELSKAVPFTFATSNNTMTISFLHHCLNHLLHYVQSAFLNPYGFWDESEGMLGATPELLCSLSPTTPSLLKTVALAGTQSKSSPPDLLQSNPKEQYEHRLVVEGICQSLAPFGMTTVQPQSVLELPTLYHLMTPIETSLKENTSLETVVRALHPTPALGAFPREPGTLWLRSIQHQIDRRRFGAPVGFSLNENTSYCWVAIRNAQWNEKGISIGAGCGIVPESDPEKEWNELMLKINATKKVLGI